MPHHKPGYADVLPLPKKPAELVAATKTVKAAMLNLDRVNATGSQAQKRRFNELSEALAVLCQTYHAMETQNKED